MRSQFFFVFLSCVMLIRHNEVSYRTIEES